MSQLCTFTRPLTCGWSGGHNPLAGKAALMAETAPATNIWTSFAIRNEQAAGYCFGFGQAFMNGYFDDKQRPQGQGVFGDYSKPEYLTQGLMVQLKIALSLSARVERGTATLVLNDSPDWANHTANMDGGARAWGQLFKHLSATEPMSMLTMHELQNGALNYDGTVAFFEKFKRIIILLSGSQWLPSDELCANLATALSRGAPIVCIQADGYSWNSNHTFNRIFKPLGLAVAGANYTHLYAESVIDYKNVYGDDLAWKSIISLYGGRRLFIAGAAAYTYNVAMPTVALDGFPGNWAQGECVEVAFNDSIYIPNVVVFRPNCCYNEKEVYTTEFDVPATIVKPDNYKQALANHVLRCDWWHELQTAEHPPEVLHVRARGWHYGGGAAPTANAIRYRGRMWDTQRSYNVMVFSRVNGDVLDYRSYDVYGDISKAAECAAFLNSIDSGRIVLVVTSDEPSRNLTQELQNALIRFGAGAAMLRRLKVRSAYMLVGIAGNPVGIERYAGAVDEDPNAVVDAAFDFRPDGARPLDTRMSDTVGHPIVATLQGIAERALFQSNWDSYQNQKATADPKVAAFNARWVKNALEWVRRGTTMEVLFVPTTMATTGDWNPLNTGPEGCSSFMDYVKAAGFNISVLDHTKISKPMASAYTKYDAVVFWAAGVGCDDFARMQILMPVLQTVIKGGAGLFAISDTAHPIMNMLTDMYSVQTNFVAGIQPESFNVQRAREMHGDHVIFAGLSGNFANDSAAGGFLTQTRLLWPYCVDGESLDIVELKENGRVAKFRYTRILDGMDARHVFTLDAWTKLTDLRFKKIDMSDTDKWPLTIEMPCVSIDDDPRFHINDVEVEEGTGVTKYATFTVGLEAPLRGRPVIVSWKVTHDSTDADDFVGATSGELIFSSTETTKTITVGIAGDNISEEDERFYIDLYNQTRGVLVKGRGVGSIVDDDGDLFNTSQFHKRVQWGVLGLPHTPDVNMFMWVVTPAWAWRDCAWGSVWISESSSPAGGPFVRENCGWWAHYRFKCGKARSYSIQLSVDNTTNIQIIRLSDGAVVFNFSFSDDVYCNTHSIYLEKGEYEVRCSIWNDADGNDWGNNPGYLGIAIRR